MKKIVLLFSLGLFLLACNSINTMAGISPEGPLVSENRDLSAFTKVDAHVSFMVKLVKSDKEAVKVEASENIMPLIETESRNGELYIGLKPGYNLKSGKGITVTVYYKQINSIYLSGSGDIEAAGELTNDVEVSLSGSGDIVVPVKTENVVAKLQGSGDITLRGAVNNLNATLTGSGDIHADKLSSNNATVTVVGSGDIATTAKASITGNINGSGNISYGGNPSKKKLSVAGSGEFSTF